MVQATDPRRAQDSSAASITAPGEELRSRAHSASFTMALRSTRCVLRNQRERAVVCEEDSSSS